MTESILIKATPKCKSVLCLFFGAFLFAIFGCQSRLGVSLNSESSDDKSVAAANGATTPVEEQPQGGTQSPSPLALPSATKLPISTAGISLSPVQPGDVTPSQSLTLTFNTPEATQVYATLKAECHEGGSWESIGSTYTWTLAAPNQLNDLFLKFRNAAETESDCIKMSVLHDGQAPSVPGQFAAGSGLAPDSSTSPNLTWTASTDALTSVDHYEVALGSGSGLSDVKNWTNIGNTTSTVINGLSISPGSTVYASVRAVDRVGNISTPASATFTYNNSPYPDLSFNSTGYNTVEMGTVNDIGYRIGLQTNGKIVVSGQTSNGTNFDIYLLRFTASGLLDSSFGTAGTVLTASGHTTTATMGMAVQASNDAILVAQNDTTNMKLYRYLANGLLDNAFGASNGIATLPLAAGDTSANTRAVGIASDGKIIVTGGGAPGYQYVTVRTDSLGAVDTSFGGTGVVKTNYPSTRATGRDVLFQSDGKIVLAGMNNYGNCLTVVRLNTDGTLDTSFNTTGRVCIAILPGGGGLGGYGRKAALQSDGKIVVVGYHIVSSVNYMDIIRLNSDGSLDTTFNSAGIVSMSDPGGTGNDVHIYSNGKILVGGIMSDGTTTRQALVRLNSNGSLDTTFNNGSAVYQAPLRGDSDNQAFGMAVQADGRVLLWGQMKVGGINKVLLSRTVIPNP